ncbi:MAG: glycosyl hydrolase family 98 C-terminal domain-containing protein, partial [Bacteroidales bacterium]|nr:glycosyl hydrolase family 98 C-terminal domain-containing protein [Bacteroidales bacterium]
QTVTDGPELIWQQDVRELSATTTPDGYTMRRWGYYPQYENISIDIFRKILDKTVRIASRKEVIDRTKVVIVNNVLSGNDWGKYATPGDLFDGLYNMDGKQMQYNTTWFKKTGRYPAIPTVFTLADSLANTFQVQVKKTQYTSRWKTVDAKVNEFNTLFPEQYTGDIFADRMDNTWMTYNPYMDENKMAIGTIPFKYNTCDHVDLFYSQYTMGVMKEYADKLTFYLTNYRTDVTVLKTDTLRVYGCVSEPVLTWKDRAKHTASKVTSTLADGVFTITVKHNGPLDIEVTNCGGAGTDRLTDYKEATIIIPAAPPVYTGAHQYEAECFDYKNVASCKTNGFNTGVWNYTGQGYMDFGASSTASIRDTISVPRAGKYRIQLRYSAPYALINNIDCYVNGVYCSTPEFAKTASPSVWAYASFTVDLKAGKSVVEVRRKPRVTINKGIYFDHMILDQSDNLSDYTFEQDSTSTEATTPVAEMITVQSGSAGIVSYGQEATTTHCFKSYSNGATNNTGVADLDLYSVTPFNSSITWKGYGTAGNKTAILMRGSDSCDYATGMKQGYLFVAENNADNTVTLRTYVATADGITEKSSYTSRFVLAPSAGCWYRAVTFGTQILFECSADGKSWQGGAETAFTDGRYERGAVQLLWGLGSSNGAMLIDQISKKSSDFTINRYALDELRTQQDKDTVQVVYVSGRDLIEGVTATTRHNFEVSLSRNANFSDSLVIDPLEKDTLDRRAVYIRLNHSSLGTFEDTVTFRSKYVEPHSIALRGELLPTPISMAYDFESDAASSVSRTPPAANVTVGTGNTTKAGVISYTDQSQTTSNMLKIYSCTSRKNSGVLNLTKFKNKSTDYSVTWKMCLTSSTDSYKNGVLLRGDTTQIGTTTTGYTPGIMSGYAFVAYNNHGSGATEFRIYKSTVLASQELTMMANTGISTLNPLAGQSVWYRATVSGSSSINLLFEYSTDGVTWMKGSSATD